MENIKRLTKDLRHINFEYFQQFEWNIKLKTECQKCLDFIVLSKTSLNPNFVLNEKSFKEKCKFIIENLQSNLVNGLKLNKYSDEAKQIEEIFKLLKKVKELLNKKITKTNLNKLFENLNEAINLIDNTNPMIAYFKELKTIEELAKFRAARILQFWKESRKVIFNEKENIRQVEILDEMEKLIYEENVKEFDERLEDKYELLLKNWEKLFFEEEKEKNIFYKQILPESDEIKKKFENSGDLFVGYCLTKRIENSFNKDGTVKISEFLSNGAGQEYGLELSEVLGQKRIDIG
ncbi:unnamed protein product [Meloidogyne enterolobii]|uniref:Uncharacterized protein n=1 Tax=Meloidogyne enterolobii TaxID=390850 RepID=A0ACB0ZUL9_MELEN